MRIISKISNTNIIANIAQLGLPLINRMMTAIAKPISINMIKHGRAT